MLLFQAQQTRNYLADKPKEPLIRALKELVSPLEDHWGHPGRFQEEAVKVLQRLLPGQFSDLEWLGVAANVRRVTLNFRNHHFKHITDNELLEQVYKALDQGGETAFHQGCLWLAWRIQQTAIIFWRGREFQPAYDKLMAEMDKLDDEALAGLFPEGPNLTLERMEGRMADLCKRSFVGHGAWFFAALVAERAISKGRMLVRTMPDSDASPLDGASSAEVRVMGVVAEKTRQVELNEARSRYAQMDEEARKELFALLRNGLAKQISRVAPLARDGLEEFSRAVEVVVFPYPRRLEWVRPFIKSLFTAAQQSSFFNGSTTPEAVDRRFAELMESKAANPLVLMIARSLARASFSGMGPQIKLEEVRLDELNFVAEFAWPETLDELANRLAANGL